MPRILLYEFLTSGGLWTGGWNLDQCGSLRREGRAMLTALAADIAALPEVETLVLRDARLADIELLGCSVQEVGSNTAERELLTRLGSQADGVILIAPESGGLLLERCRWIEEAGGRLLCPSSAIVALAGDKQHTAKHLAAHGVPTPEGRLLNPGDALPQDFSYPAVLKPRDGCGSQDVALIPEPLADAPSALRFSSSMRLERFAPGLAASVAVLCGPQELQPLVPCRQRLSDDGRFQYLGGSFPLPPNLARRAQSLAQRAIATLPQPRGYLGVDLVLGNEPSGAGDAIIEINPRLTTSYIGLRAAAVGNLAEAMWAIAQGWTTDLSFGDKPVEFDADGVVRVLGAARRKRCG